MVTDFRNNKRSRYKLLAKPEAMIPQEIVSDFTSLKSPSRDICVVLKNPTKLGMYQAWISDRARREVSDLKATHGKIQRKKFQNNFYLSFSKESFSTRKSCFG